MTRFPAVFLTLFATACGSKAPCTQCPNVAGTYSETSPRQETSCGNGDTLYWSGGDAVVVTVTQDGSALHLVREGRLTDTLEGVLYDDSSAEFGPFSRQLTSSDGSVAIGDVTLAGRFMPTGSPLFAGTWMLKMQGTGCAVTSKAKWSAAQ
ncbi:MAG: hypothetical protein QM765_45715 [Myxococcales bacterium]